MIGKRAAQLFAFTPTAIIAADTLDEALDVAEDVRQAIAGVSGVTAAPGGGRLRHTGPAADDGDD